MLTEDSMDEEFYKSPLTQEQKWLTEYHNNQNRSSQKNDSSSYSFSTDYSSELEEVYEQFAKYIQILVHYYYKFKIYLYLHRWLDGDAALNENGNKLDSRDEAILSFANSLLKRTLSESFVGVPLTEGSLSTAGTNKQ